MIECLSILNYQLLSLGKGLRFFHVVLGFEAPINEHGFLFFVHICLALLTVLNDQVWFLGENANYAAGEYAWESATSPSTALMMLDGDKMVAAASSRNPTLVGAITRLQRCAISGSWEVGACNFVHIDSMSGALPLHFVPVCKLCSLTKVTFARFVLSQPKLLLP